MTKHQHNINSNTNMVRFVLCPKQPQHSRLIPTAQVSPTHSLFIYLFFFFFFSFLQIVFHKENTIVILDPLHICPCTVPVAPPHKHLSLTGATCPVLSSPGPSLSRSVSVLAATQRSTQQTYSQHRPSWPCSSPPCVQSAPPSSPSGHFDS